MLLILRMGDCQPTGRYYNAITCKMETKLLPCMSQNLYPTAVDGHLISDVTVAACSQIVYSATWSSNARAKYSLIKEGYFKALRRRAPQSYSCLPIPCSRVPGIHILIPAADDGTSIISDEPRSHCVGTINKTLSIFKLLGPSDGMHCPVGAYLDSEKGCFQLSFCKPPQEHGSYSALVRKDGCPDQWRCRMNYIRSI